MTAVQEIQEAIDRLTELRKASPYVEMHGWLAEKRPSASGAIDDPGYDGITDDPLIVTLHRTIDVQLLTLGYALLRARATGIMFMFSTYGCLSLALAHAILEDIA